MLVESLVTASIANETPLDRAQRARKNTPMAVRGRLQFILSESRRENGLLGPSAMEQLLETAQTQNANDDSFALPMAA